MVIGARRADLSAAAFSRRRARISETHEVAQPDRRQDAERDPLDAVGQERPRVQVRQGDHAEAARLILDQLQIRPGQRNAEQRRDLRGVDRVHLLRAVLTERRLALGAGSESRSRASIVTGPSGGGAMARHPRTLLGFHIAAVDQDRRPAVDDERHQHLVGGLALDHPEPRQHLAVGQIVPGRCHPLPLLIGRRRILLRQNACQRQRARPSAIGRSARSRGIVLVFLPSCHGASTVKHR